jgi:hypothetical protein
MTVERGIGKVACSCVFKIHHIAGMDECDVMDANRGVHTDREVRRASLVVPTGGDVGPEVGLVSVSDDVDHGGDDGVAAL